MGYGFGVGVSSLVFVERNVAGRKLNICNLKKLLRKGLGLVLSFELSCERDSQGPNPELSNFGSKGLGLGLGALEQYCRTMQMGWRKELSMRIAMPACS